MLFGEEKETKEKISLAVFLDDTPGMSLADPETIFQGHLKTLRVEMNRYMPENVKLQKHS